MSLSIREAGRADSPEIARIFSAVMPQRPLTAEILDHQLQALLDHPLRPHVREWLAEVDGEAVGQAVVFQNPSMFHPDRYQVELMVVPTHAQRGVGTRLAQEVETHLQERGAREVLGGAYEDHPHAVAFAQRRGLKEVMRVFDNVLNLETFDFSAWESGARLPAGVRARTLAELTQEGGEDAAMRAYHSAFSEVRLDVPRSGDATEQTMDDFRKRAQSPNFFPDGVLLAVTDSGEAVALSELWRSPTGPHRLDVGLTGTRRAWRRKGLALALKLEAMRRASAAGVQELWTGNATTNAPMLELNTRLGFRPRPAYIEFRWRSE
ncbi:GNAT family N-acetyltransferase [Deinococcus deserti]|uniref:Putative N-acetyltransferase n=1 Tax=Deinococcus deserti (strain DSM 17065 / CIP 109153 / LMG 22923 / VCD115) TaxID=546414 RepID=C1CY37_DEIDV|nr:GNAT family N-acetyltransferase [Deinococcus deserti]ACO46993.1 putative N-acetyltransferase [Deinococcus deserti VCD115]